MFASAYIKSIARKKWVQRIVDGDIGNDNLGETKCRGELVALAIQDGQRFIDEAEMMYNPQKEILTACAPLAEMSDDKIIRKIHLCVRNFLLDSLEING